MENMEKELKRLRKSMAITRVFCVIPAILFAVIVVGGIYVWGQVSGIVENVMPAVEAVSEVDWVALAEKVEQFDVEALNKTLGSINADELNEAVENLNDASDALKKVTSIFK